LVLNLKSERKSNLYEIKKLTVSSIVNISV